LSQLFTIFLNILAPVFSLVLIGYLAGPWLQLDARTLSRLAYFILTPAFIFNVFRSAEIQAPVAVRMFAYITCVTLATVVVALLVARSLGLGRAMVAAFVLVAAFGNVGNFGLPIIQFKLGNEALLAASVYFLIMSTSGFVIGVAAASWSRGGGLSALGSVARTPAILAVVPAFLVNGTDMVLPTFIERAVALMAAALIPVMLLTLGVQLSEIGKLTFNRNVMVAGSLRLIVGPILALALASIFDLTGIYRGAGVLQAAMPSAVLASLIALEHDLLPDFVTTAVLFSTLASAVTLTLVLTVV
jgi:predicted permease